MNLISISADAIHHENIRISCIQTKDENVYLLKILPLMFNIQVYILLKYPTQTALSTKPKHKGLRVCYIFFYGITPNSTKSICLLKIVCLKDNIFFILMCMLFIIIIYPLFPLNTIYKQYKKNRIWNIIQTMVVIVTFIFRHWVQWRQVIQMDVPFQQWAQLEIVQCLHKS